MRSKNLKVRHKKFEFFVTVRSLTIKSLEIRIFKNRYKSEFKSPSNDKNVKYLVIKFISSLFFLILFAKSQKFLIIQQKL